MGLTDADYKESPYRRYAASQNDEMNTRHNAYQLNYAYRFGDGYELLATAYVNDFHRNWYKASKVGTATLSNTASLKQTQQAKVSKALA